MTDPEPRYSAVQPNDRVRRYALAAVDAALAQVRATPEGARRMALNRAAFCLGQILGGADGALSRADVEPLLVLAGIETGLAADEVRRTVHDGLADGAAAPRDLSHVAANGAIRRTFRPQSPAATHTAVQLPNNDENRERARDVVQGSRPALGTPAEAYLRARGIVVELPASLTFHPDVTMAAAGRHPCLIAAVTVPTTGEFLAIQRTALRADGSAKAAIAEAKLSLGGTRGGAVVLGDLAAGEAVVEGEGVETVLSGCDAVGWPGIATLSCDALGRTPLPPGRPVLILVDRGAEVKARAGARRRHDEGRAVRLAYMPDDLRPGQHGVDANDLLRDRGHDAVRAMIEVAVPYRPDPMAPAPLPDGFGRRPNGWITWNAITPDGEPVDEPLCSPMEILAATRDGEGSAWGLLVRVRNRDGAWVEWSMPMAWLAGDGRELRAALLAAGLQITPGQAARNALGRLLATVEPEARARSVGRLGWHGRAYVLPDAVIGDTEGERVVWQPEVRMTHAYRTGGTLDGWRVTVAAPAVGNSRLVLAIATAFAAPLLGLLGAESGGFHCRGQSSVGKTTLLRVAGSVWGGGGIDGFIRRWRSTTNGLEGLAMAHNDGLLCLDELAEIDARDAYRAAYMLANGQGKQRAGHSGEARPAHTWRLLFLSTGELSLADKIAEDGRRVTAGQEVRVVDLPADAGAGLGLFENLHGAADADAFARQTRAATAMHYGHPARAFLDAVAYDLDGAGGRLREAMRTFEAEHRPPEASGQVLRVLARFALVAAAGELAAHYGTVPWPHGEASAGVGCCWRDWLVARGGGGDLEADRAVAQVRAFIEAHGSSRFEPLTGPAQMVRDRVGFSGSGPDGERRWYVLTGSWRTVCDGIDPKLAARALAERGMLEHDPGGYQVRRRIRDMGQVRVYALTPALLEA